MSELCCTVVPVMENGREKMKKRVANRNPTLDSTLEMCFLFDGQMASRSSSSCLGTSGKQREKGVAYALFSSCEWMA